jgi:hypothetical protein
MKSNYKIGQLWEDVDGDVVEIVGFVTSQQQVRLRLLKNNVTLTMFVSYLKGCNFLSGPPP